MHYPSTSPSKLSQTLHLEVAPLLTFLLSATALFLASDNPLYLLTAGGVLLLFKMLPTLLPHKKYYIEKNTSDTLILLALLYLLSSVLKTNQDILLELALFLFMVQAIRLLALRKELYHPLEEQRYRDYYQLYTITIAQLAVASALGIKLAFLPLFLCFLLTSPYLLLVFHLRQEQEGQKIFCPPPAKLYKTCAIAGIITLLPTTALFWLLPRYKQSLFTPPKLRRTNISGFSENISLNDISYILQSPEVVMRVQFLDPPPNSPLLFRGNVYDIYENQQWFSSANSKNSYIPNHRSYRIYTSWNRNSPKFYREQKLQQEIDQKNFSNIIRQKIFINPLNTNIVFGLFPILRLEILGQTPLPTLYQDTHDVLRLQKFFPHPWGYIAYSPRLQYSLEKLKKSKTFSPKATYLSWPKNTKLHKKRFQKLAQKILQQSPAKSPYEKAIALENFLRHNYRYTLHLPNTTGKIDPIEEFLFLHKQGHCEYFASALVLLLRSIQLPARLVNGFRGGEYNHLGNYYIIRQKNAHAWAELFLGNIGWIPLDPTPPSNRQQQNTTSPFSLTHWLDYLRMQWMSKVIQYNKEDQQNLFQYLYQLLLTTPDLLLNISPSTPILTLLLIIICALLLWKKRKKLHPTTSPQKQLPQLQELLQQLAKQGHPIAANETLLEFVQRIFGETPLKQDGIHMVKLYYLWRFGQKKLTPNQWDTLHQLIKKLSCYQQNRPASSVSS
ncbi:MAG: DUF3488 domain-containing protein [Planctomycetota bacterium]|nr:MAG: DUF3488 domain-containing protein [Planctomycetota bacterium]